VPGVYDRFGAIEPEKIHWSVDNLLELHAFAHYMEVHWIGDMVVDRLHWMFCEQKRQCDMCHNNNEDHGWTEVNGKMKLVGGKLSSVPNLETCTLSARDFDTQALGRLMVETIDVPALTFYADLMKSLGGALDANWLSRAPQQVQDIFVLAAASPRDLIDMSREQFYSRYHHHSDNGLCYTAGPDHTAHYLVHQLYAISSRNELIKLSLGVTSPESLASIMYRASGASETLEEANSSPDMLDAEKMVMEMDMRLEDAKAALHKARAVDRCHKAKDIAIQEAKNLAEQLIKPLNVVRKQRS
jgi:ribosomal protein L7/L12